jgi:hypothetical protein
LVVFLPLPFTSQSTLTNFLCGKRMSYYRRKVAAGGRVEIASCPIMSAEEAARLPPDELFVSCDNPVAVIGASFLVVLLRLNCSPSFDASECFVVVLLDAHI